MADPGSRSSGPTAAILVVGMIVAMILAAAFVPLAACSNCEGTGRMEATSMGGVHGPALPLVDCPRCSGCSRVTLLKRWRMR